MGQGTKAKGSACRKPTLTLKKDLLDNICEPLKAIRMYPASKVTLNETGIPEDLQVSHEQATTLAGGSIYLCHHPVCQEGMPFSAQSPAALYSHVRCKHIGLVLACPYCANKVFWNSQGWKGHMSGDHKDVPHYGSALTDEAAEAIELLAKAPEDSPLPHSSPSQRHRKVLKKKVRKEKPSSSSSSEVQTSTDSSPDSSSSDQDVSNESAGEAKPPIPVGVPPTVVIKKELSENPATQLEFVKSLPPDPPLTCQQLEYIKEGAYALRAQPTLESLIKYPHAWKQPVSSVVAFRDLARHSPQAQQLAASLVVQDLPPSSDTSVDPPTDMPPLESTPPRKQSRRDKD